MTSLDSFLPYVSAIATVITMGLFTVPYNDIKSFHRAGTVGKRPFLPFLSMLNNCIIWTIYGMLTRTMTIIFVNGYGILLSAYCCVAFISLSAPEVQSTYIRNVSIVLFVGLACLVASYYDHVTFTPIVGYYASFLSVSVFAAPLAEIMQVFRTRSVETISFNIAVVSMLSCTFWCLFGVLISDNNVLIPNFLGGLLSLCQLSLFVLFPDHTAKQTLPK